MLHVHVLRLTFNLVGRNEFGTLGYDGGGVVLHQDGHTGIH